MLEVFNNPAFTVWSLTLSLTNRPFVPGLIGSLGLFEPRFLATTMTLVEVRGHRLALVPERPRGAPPPPDVQDRRALVPVGIPHFPIRTSIFADEVQNVRAFGTDNQLEAVQTVVDEREGQLGQRLDLTQEYLRLGAVKGLIVTEADRETGAPMTVVNLHNMFHVDEQPVIEWPIIGAGGGGEASFWTGQLTGLIMALGREMANSISGGLYQRIHGIAGSVAYDAFAMHPEARAPFLATDNAPLTRGMLAPAGANRLSFRDITIDEYRGQVGNIRFVEPDEIHFFPVGVPGLFLEIYSPADYMETVNTIALTRYSKMRAMDWDKGVEVESQMNVLPICTAPRALFTVKVTPSPLATGAAAAPHAGNAGGRQRVAA
jgi:hypothetical protein